MIQLGNKIELEGFEDIEPAAQIIVRKMIGTLARKIEETKGAYEKLKINKTATTVSMKAEYAGNQIEGSAEHNNLFFAISGAFQQLLQ